MENKEKFGNSDFQPEQKDVSEFKKPAKSISQSGWLLKQGHVHKNWLRRYFILHENTLYYFEDKPSKPKSAPLGMILIDSDAIILDLDPTADRPKENCLLVQSGIGKKKPYYISADHEVSKIVWLYSLLSARDPNVQTAEPIVDHYIKNDIGEVCIEGYMMKRVHVKKNWKRRFFTLRNIQLSYYESRETMKLKGDIIVDKMCKIIDLGSKGPKEGCFMVESGKGKTKTFYFQADNRISKRLWIKGLMVARDPSTKIQSKPVTSGDYYVMGDTIPGADQIKKDVRLGWHTWSDGQKNVPAIPKLKQFLEPENPASAKTFTIIRNPNPASELEEQDRELNSLIAELEFSDIIDKD